MSPVSELLNASTAVLRAPPFEVPETYVSWVRCSASSLQKQPDGTTTVPSVHLLSVPHVGVVCCDVVCRWCYNEVGGRRLGWVPGPIVLLFFRHDKGLAHLLLMLHMQQSVTACRACTLVTANFALHCPVACIICSTSCVFSVLLLRPMSINHHQNGGDTGKLFAATSNQEHHV
jgi:hypothetical protein